MSAGFSYITQSKFYSPAFNAAIFDGPMRLYFAQYQEPQALNFYFNLQEQFRSEYQRAKELFRTNPINIFVMLYPNNETFKLSFDQETSAALKVQKDSVGVDHILGAEAVMSESVQSELCNEFAKIIQLWEQGALNPGSEVVPEMY